MSVTLPSLISVGTIFGVLGFGISIANFMRDTPKVKVVLDWDSLDSNNAESIGVIRVTNVGRRSIFITQIFMIDSGRIEDLRNEAVKNSPIPEPDEGTRLEEGDAPIVRYVSHYTQKEYKGDWRQVRAFAKDSTGKTYKSSLTLAAMLILLRVANPPKQLGWKGNN